MPVMNGIEATEILKREKKTKDIPIIIVTAATNVGNKIKAAKGGANEFISKPVDLIELEIRIKNLIKLREYLSLMTNYHIELEKEVERRTEKLKILLKEKETLFY